MSLYEIAVADGGQAERAAVLLPMLGSPDIPRFRDVWAERSEDGDPLIAIYTRTGGGNRADYAEAIAALIAHPCYLRDADDEFDATYATFRFSVPLEHRAAAKMLAVNPVDTDERWRQAIERIGSGSLRPAETALADQIQAFLGDPGDGPRVMKI